MDEAGSLDFEVMGEFYPGVRAHASGAYFAALSPLLAKVVREVFGYRQELKLLRSLYSLVTTPPADLSLAQRVPHIDSVDDGRIAVLHYLTREDRGGTSFYRHRSTGFETIDQSRHHRTCRPCRPTSPAMGRRLPATSTATRRSSSGSPTSRPPTTAP